jgi:hypothetical protein
VTTSGLMLRCGDREELIPTAVSAP